MATVKIDPSKTYQTMESFGGSGAWWAQVVGGWEQIDPASGKPVRDRIAELLCHDERGIGMRCYRYNLGGGSKNSGSCAFSKGNRGAEVFETGEGKYDWNRDKNAVYMLREVVKNGADEIVFFVNSPPERLTKNHKSCLDKPWRTNLKKKNERPFAHYVLDVAEHFVAEGIPIKYVSPVNEPLWVWTERHGQEGCHYKPWGVRSVTRVFAEELEKRQSLKGVKLSGAENGDIRWFNKAYTRAVLNDPVIRKNLDSIDIHSYFLPIVKWKFFNDRHAFLKRYRKWMDRHYPDVPIKMSEWTHMQGGRDKGMDSALEQAKIMFEDISILNVTSWQHWIAVSECDYCDGLIYINESDGTFEMTKRYYAFGNFSKFVKKGSVRVDVSCDDADIKLLAFKNGAQTVLIAINVSSSEKTLTLPSVFRGGKLYVTSDNDELSESAINGDTVAAPARSVSTAVSGH